MEKLYKPSQFAKMLNITVHTLQRWDREGILKAKRTITNRRYYTESQYNEAIGNVNNKDCLRIGVVCDD